MDFYDKNCEYLLPKRFLSREEKILDKSKYNHKYNHYLDSINDQDVRAFAKYLFSMRGNDFTFSYSYFDYFCETYKNRNIFKPHDKNMDIILSAFMLNEYTKWFDALMLLNNMPLDFCRQTQFLLLKVLATQPLFQRIVSKLTDIHISTTADEITFNYNGQTNSCCNFFHQFYKLAEKRLNSRSFLELFSEPKNSSAQKRIGIFSIIEWIYLLEHDCIYNKHIDINYLLTEGYRRYEEKLQRRELSANPKWLKPIINGEFY